MKNIFKIILILVITSSFFSCKKEELKHKVTFEVKFLDTPNKGSSNFIEIYTKPTDVNQTSVDRFNVPKVWRYEYIGLVKGDKVELSVNGQLSYYFEMRVFIDDKEVSYMKVKVSDTVYYGCTVLERSGLNDLSNENVGYISFKY